MRQRNRKSGFVLITMALAAFALFGALGLSIDLGRVYVVKNETQTFCDSASLAAAIKLNGLSTGIASAQSAVANNANTWNLNTQAITSPQVDFATTSSGPWVTNPSPATGYTYVRVRASAPVSLYFLPLVNNTFTQTVQSTAIAAQVPQSGFKQGLAPYTAVAQNNSKSNAFGFEVGKEYDIQWPQFNDTRAGCDKTGGGDPTKCFNTNPCHDEGTQAMSNVVKYWGSKNSGYWGAQSASDITGEVLDVIQLTPVSIGDNITPVLSTGTKDTEGGILDQRVNQDGDINHNDPATYLSDPSHNGRRLIAVPVVNPESTTTTEVVGFAAFLLKSEPSGGHSDYYKKQNGNDPYCAVYVGAYVQGSTDSGGGSVGSYKIMLVQ